MIFKRKKKKLENFDAIGLINDIALPLTPFGGKIINSDVVLICIDRIASQCAKLKGRCIKRSEDGIITERNKSLSFLLKSKPNEYMTPYQFIYKVVSLLLLNVLIMDIKGDAEYVFLGAPIWWQELNWVIEEFVSENDFTGKTIIPFGTSASSGFSLDNIEPLAEEANWMAPQRFRSSTSESEVINRIDGFNISFN